MTESSRRKLLKSIAAGSGAVIAGKSLPDSWSRPMVDAVILPAHAQTSMMNSAGLASGVQQIFQREPARNSLLADAYKTLLPEAQAGFAAINSLPQICVEHVQEGGGPVDVANFSAMVVYQVNQTCLASLIFSAKNVPVKGNPAKTDLTFIEPCESKAGVDEFLDTIGLIDKAYAVVETPWVAIQTFNGPNGGAHGQFSDGRGATFSFSLPRAQCPGFLPVCSDAGCVDSDRNIKANFAPVDEQAILDKVARLPIETWNYTDREPGVKHIGPMAQDFMAAFGVGDSDKHIHMVDANGVNLAAIKALNRRLEEKEAQIQVLTEKLDAVMQKLDNLA